MGKACCAAKEQNLDTGERQPKVQAAAVTTNAAILEEPQQDEQKTKKAVKSKKVSKKQVELEGQMKGQTEKIKLYWKPNTTNSRALKSILDAGGMTYEEQAINNFKEVENFEIKMKNPGGMMPFLTWNDTCETDVIVTMKRLCTDLPFMVKFYPVKQDKRLPIDAALEFYETNFMIAIKKRHFASLVIKHNGGMTTEGQKMINEADLAVDEAMQALEEMFNVNGKKWLCGDFPCIADYLIGAQCTDLMLHGNQWGAYPKACAWRHKMFIETPGFREVHADWFRTVLPKSISISLPMGAPSNLPEIDQRMILEIIEYCWPPEGNNRHLYPFDEVYERQFQQDEEKDAFIMTNYLPLIEKAQAGELDEWKNDHYGRLALIIISDIFTRCVHRGTNQCFSLDGLSQEVTEYILQHRSEDGAGSMFDNYRFGEKLVILMPLMHKESMDSMEVCIEKLQTLMDDANNMGYDAFVIATELAIKFAEHHQEPLKIFGRFPTRNECLYRENTPEEEEWLQNEDNNDGTIQ